MDVDRGVVYYDMNGEKVLSRYMSILIFCPKLNYVKMQHETSSFYISMQPNYYVIVEMQNN